MAESNPLVCFKKVSLSYGNNQVLCDADFDIDAGEPLCVVGPNGGGKTTLIKALLSTLGSDDNVSSPTFSLVNEYRLSDGSPVYHFDFYRINAPEEALDIGVEEYLESGYLCLIEWPDRIGPFIPEIHGKISITLEGESRVIAVEPPAINS